jgi:hypothetical protein
MYFRMPRVLLPASRPAHWQRRVLQLGPQPDVTKAGGRGQGAGPGFLNFEPGILQPPTFAMSSSRESRGACPLAAGRPQPQAPEAGIDRPP